MNSLPATPRLMAIVGVVALLAASEAGAFPHCWGAPTTVETRSDSLAALKARIDSEGRLHLFWYDSGLSTICRVERDTSGTWGDVEHVIDQCDEGDFAVALDGSDGLHIVWKADAGFGAAGQTSHLYYKTKPDGQDWGDSVCITPTFNDPDSVETPAVESFDTGVPPFRWGADCSNTEGCYPGYRDTKWGDWLSGGSQYSPPGDSACAMLKRQHGCHSGCQGSECYTALVLPPLLVSEGDSLSFLYRVAASGDEAAVRVKVIDTFAFGDIASFDTSRVGVIWENSAIANTVYSRAAARFPAGMNGKIVFAALILSGTADTSDLLCIDSLFVGLDEEERPEIALNPCVCSRPSLYVGGNGDVHLSFVREHWQPDACACTGQLYYSRRDHLTGGWGTPAYVDSSGVGDRNYDKPRLYRGAFESDLVSDDDGDVHLLWRDVLAMNAVDDALYSADDILYSYRSASSGDSEWQESPFRVSDDGPDSGAVDGNKALAPHVALDPSGGLLAVFHGSRPAWSRAVPGEQMVVWCRRMTPGGSWPDTCVAVSDPAVDYEILNCRTPSIDLDSDGNMFVAYTWQDVVNGKLPWGSAFATYIANDDQWVQPARIITHLADTMSVVRPICVQVDDSGDAHLAWIEDDRHTQYDDSAYRWRVMYMKSLDWTTCLDTIQMTPTETYIRGLSPNEQLRDGTETRPFEIAFTITDTSGCPMAQFPTDEFYVAVESDCTNPPADTCHTFNPGLSCSAWSPPLDFLCQDEDTVSSFTLFVTEKSDAQGQAWAIWDNNVSGAARLRLTPYLGAELGTGDERIVWVNTPDHLEPKGCVIAGDFAAFATAYVGWNQSKLEDWTWDFVLREDTQWCVTDTTTGETRPVFELTGADFAFFSTYYGLCFVDTADCHSE